MLAAIYQCYEDSISAPHQCSQHIAALPSYLEPPIYYRLPLDVPSRFAAISFRTAVLSIQHHRSMSIRLSACSACITIDCLASPASIIICTISPLLRPLPHHSSHHSSPSCPKLYITRNNLGRCTPAIHLDRTIASHSFLDIHSHPAYLRLQRH